VSTPPRGPEHDPVNSPEAASRCPEQWQAAKGAREQLIGATYDQRERADGVAAQAVLAQADCEAGEFARWTIDAGPQAMVTAELAGSRRQYQTALNLYQEVASTHEGEFRVLALTGAARLHMHFADKLAGLPMPSDTRDSAGRRQWTLQQLELGQYFASEAQAAASAAVDLVGDAPGGGGELAQAWAQCCQILAAVDPRGRPAACGHSPGGQP